MMRLAHSQAPSSVIERAVVPFAADTVSAAITPTHATNVAVHVGVVAPAYVPQQYHGMQQMVAPHGMAAPQQMVPSPGIVTPAQMAAPQMYSWS